MFGRLDSSLSRLLCLLLRDLCRLRCLAGENSRLLFHLISLLPNGDCNLSRFSCHILCLLHHILCSLYCVFLPLQQCSPSLPRRLPAKDVRLIATERKSKPVYLALLSLVAALPRLL